MNIGDIVPTDEIRVRIVNSMAVVITVSVPTAVQTLQSVGVLNLSPIMKRSEK